MNIKGIKTDAEYKEALQRLEIIFDAKLNSEEGDELQVLGALADEYEKLHFPIETPDPSEAAKFRKEQFNQLN
ncbi:MAG: DNA-binding protein [Mucilaginibacter sp.]|nr:DNA-binding protein [Mucilaginibacter sp.]